jgi:murein tripeptide amidase MpaA
MARRRRSTLTLSAEQAHQALAFLVHEGKLASNEVRQALDRRERLIREIKERMGQLGVEGLQLTTRLAKGASRKIRAARKVAPPTRRLPQRVRKRVSAVRKAAMRRQGKYLAAVRQLSGQDRAKVKEVLKSKGWAAAMAEAKRMAK